MCRPSHLQNCTFQLYGIADLYQIYTGKFCCKLQVSNNEPLNSMQTVSGMLMHFRQSDSVHDYRRARPCSFSPDYIS